MSFALYMDGRSGGIWDTKYMKKDCKSLYDKDMFNFKKEIESWLQASQTFEIV